jgi:flagellar motor switch protein FliN
VSEAVVYEQLDQDPQATAAAPAPEGSGGDRGSAVTPPPGHDVDADLRRLSEVPVELSVEIGRTRMTVGETLELRAGSIVTLERLAGEPVDLLVNGTPIARGEVVVVDEQFGLRVTEIVAGEPNRPQLEDAGAEIEGVSSDGAQASGEDTGASPLDPATSAQAQTSAQE